MKSFVISTGIIIKYEIPVMKDEIKLVRNWVINSSLFKGSALLASDFVLFSVRLPSYFFRYEQ